MIPYEELEKALLRWRSRRPEGPAAVAGAAADGADVATEASHHGIPTGISEEEAASVDSTGELEIGDSAVVDDA